MLENLLMNRRSTRKFTDKKVEAEKIQAIVKGALTSPSGNNLKPSEIIVVENSETLIRLGDARGKASKLIGGAPLAFVVIGDTKKSTTWLSDTAIMATIIQLLAEEQGLKSCWVHVENRVADNGSNVEENIKGILDIPSHYTPHCIIAIGYPAEDKRPYTEKDLDYTRVHRERF
ncbi:MAG TPA: NAD(P)H nitroreductase [Eubacteriaceae bacterium]|jgi:nitroreductase|nr:NAD(P)H nitroreductase [Eubacteriaceae bacterium]